MKKGSIINSNILIKNCFKNIILFELFVKLISYFVVYPSLGWLLDLSIEYSFVDYITKGNIDIYFKSAVVYPFLLVIFFIWSILQFYEISGLILCFNSAYNGKKKGFFSLIKDSFTKSFKAFNRHNYKLIALMMVLTPFFNMFLFYGSYINSSFVTYIFDFIKENILLKLLLGLIIILLLFLLCRWLFVCHYVVLENKKPEKATELSIKMFKKHWINIILNFVFYNIFIIIFTFGIYFLLSLALYYVLKIFSSTKVLLSLIISIITIFSVVIRFLLQMFLTVANIALSYILFSKYKGKTKELKVKENEVKYRTPRRKLAISCVILTVILINSTLFYFNIHKGILTNIGYDSGMVVMAHRGDCIETPENSLSSIREAIDADAEYAEIDVQLTKDGYPVLSHDISLKRITGVDVNIYDLTLAEVKEYDIGSYMSSEFKDERIPTLEEAIVLADNKIKLNIEIKYNVHNEGIEEAVIEVIENNDFVSDCIITSFSEDVLKTVKDTNKNIKTGLIVSIALGDFYSDYADYYSLNYAIITEELIDEIHSMNSKVYAWTVNDEESINLLAKMGCDGIITDDPSYSRAIIYSNYSITVKLFFNWFFDN